VVMNKPNRVSRAEPSSWITANAAVAKLVGWGANSEGFDGFYVWEDLELRQGAATDKREIHNVIMKLVGATEDPELPTMTAAELVENDAAIARWNQMLRDSHRYMKDLAAEIAKGSEGELEFRGEWHIDGALIKLCYTSVESWVKKKYGRSLTGALASNLPSPPKVSASVKPWLIIDPSDPTPIQPWYTPARYFARQFVREEPTLLTKRGELVERVAKAFRAVGIKKRGGIKYLDPGTIRKALVKVRLG
jgi:hypothetical protein